jgi:hypothetical protein
MFQNIFTIAEFRFTEEAFPFPFPKFYQTLRKNVPVPGNYESKQRGVQLILLPGSDAEIDGGPREPLSPSTDILLLSPSSLSQSHSQ